MKMSFASQISSRTIVDPAKSEGFFPPLIFNIFKPAGIGSFDVVRHFKRNLPKGSFGKIGHFGTLDPFACGVLMVGIGGAARLNDLVHSELPKTYLAIGKLGIEKDTGDHEGKTLQVDTSAYLPETIGSFSSNFIQNLFREKFLGEYWQAPHQFSAAKYEGRPLHSWAREGIEIKKDKVLRHIYQIEVVKWKCPYLSVRVTVSSGTYVRTLFSEMAQELGTLGHLIALQRESVGSIAQNNSLRKKDWPLKGDIQSDIGPKALSPEQVLPFPVIVVDEIQMKKILNGAPILCVGNFTKGQRVWLKDSEGHLLGLAQEYEGNWKVEINFAASQASLQAENNRS